MIMLRLMRHTGVNIINISVGAIRRVAPIWARHRLAPTKINYYMIPVYPEISNITMGLRIELHPLFKGLGDGISEFTFANIYLFREVLNYQISRLPDNLYLI